MESATLPAHLRLYPSWGAGLGPCCLLVALENVRELGPVLLVGGGEDPVLQHVLDAGLEGTERHGSVDTRALHASGEADGDAHDDLAVGEAAVAQQGALVAGLDAELV